VEVKRAEEEEKGACSTRGAPFIAARGGGMKAAQIAGGGGEGKAMGTTKRWWPQSEGCQRGWAPLFGQGP
jgi:hypothetical protein